MRIEIVHIHHILKLHDYFEGVEEAICGSVILTKLHPHLILIRLKACFISTHLNLLDLICIFKHGSGEFCFQTLKKNRTHQALKINSRHNKILQCLSTVFKIKSQLLSMARKLSLYDSETTQFLPPLNKPLSQQHTMTYGSQTHKYVFSPINSAFFFQPVLSYKILLISGKIN